MTRPSLHQRIERMRRQAQNGVVVPGDLVRLLDDVNNVLSSRNTIEATMPTLTYCQRQMLAALLDALPEETGGRVVLYTVAERAGVSMSAAAALLRRLEAAGILRACPMGRQGTMVRLAEGVTIDSLRRCLDAA